MMEKFDQVKELQIEEIMSTLPPPPQQVLVKACISAAKAKSPNGKRYSIPSNEYMNVH
jgi:hypothetical protein